MEIRPISADEIPRFLEAMSGPFAFDLPDDEGDRADQIERFATSFEPERSRCAFDGDRLVGTLGAFSLALTTPGGAVACAGTTMVTVQATHRRQGVLRRMMGAHLAEARDNGDPVAALWASDSAIYRRFGFGLASLQVDLEVDRRHVEFGRLAPDRAPVRVIDAGEAAHVLPVVYDQIRPTIPGFYARSEDWWRHRRLRDTPARRDGASRFRFVVSGTETEPSGYAQFRVKEGWKDDHGHHEIRIVELVAADGPAWSGLWSHVLSLDLAGKIVAGLRSPDDPLLDLLAGPRRAKTSVRDGLWVRILDVAGALAARRYRTDGDITFEVHDPLGIDGGVFRLAVGTEGTGSCVRSTGTADISLDIEDLGAVYLGRARLASLGRLGRVRGPERMLARADAMFGWSVAPWCPEVF